MQDNIFFYIVISGKIKIISINIFCNTYIQLGFVYDAYDYIETIKQGLFQFSNERKKSSFG